MYFFLEMLGMMSQHRFPFSTDLSLRYVIRNFGDDFVQFYIYKEKLGVKDIVYLTSTWDGVRQFAMKLRPFLHLKAQIRLNSGLLLNFSKK